MTKMHETYYYGKISDLLKEIVIKGEFVIVVPGRRFRNHEEKNKASLRPGR